MTEHDNGADLRERFDHAMNDLSAPEHLTAGVLNDGRRMRRRRRILTTGGGVAAAAVVAALVAANLGGGSPSTEPQVATQGPPTPKASEKISGLPSPGPDEWPDDRFPEDPEGWWDMPATMMAAELAALLPEGTRLTDAETTNTDRAPGEKLAEMEGYLTAVLRPAEGGPGKVNMVFYPPTTGGPVPPPQTDADGNVRVFATGPTPIEMVTCDPDWIENPENCTEIPDADGNPLARVLDSTGNGVRSLSLDLLTAEGGVLMINVANTLADKWPTGATPSADEVPLNLATLREIAENPVWTSYEP